jgi:hypothetical protein
MEKARRACEAIFLDEGLPQIIVEITSSNFNIYTIGGQPCLLGRHLPTAYLSELERRAALVP